MSVYWWLCAVALILGFTLVQAKGTAFVERLTGREARPERGSGASEGLYALIYFGLALSIGLPPIYLLPSVDPLAYCFFWFVGITFGTLAAQTFFGRKVQSREARL